VDLWGFITDHDDCLHTRTDAEHVCATSFMQSSFAVSADGGVFRNLSQVSTRIPTKQAVAHRQKPVLHILFLIRDRMPHAAVWQRFFQLAPPDSYHIWVHCAQDCDEKYLRSILPDAHRVPTVSTQYCFDLVTPFIQLLRFALYRHQQATVPNEKFVLVSESTLPVKPYDHVYKLLTADDLSDFSTWMSDKWPAALVNGKPTLLVKSSQWSFLNRRHAQKMVQEWRPAPAQATFWSVSVSSEHKSRLFRWEFQPALGYGSCIDEEAVYATVCGAFDTTEAPTASAVKKCDGTTDVHYPTTQFQGRHRTFVMWRELENTDPLAKALLQDKSSQITLASGFHPSRFVRMSREALASMRVSDYLFARKFEVGSYNPEDIDILVASDIMGQDAPLTAGTTVQVQAPLIFLMHADPHEEEGTSAVGEELASELSKMEPSAQPLEVPVMMLGSELSKMEPSEIPLEVRVRMPLVVLHTKDAIKNAIT